MLNLPNADANTNFEVLEVKDSHKLWKIPEGKRVVVEYNGLWQPIGKNGSKFRCMTGKILGVVRLSGYQMIGKRYQKVRRRMSGVY